MVRHVIEGEWRHKPRPHYQWMIQRYKSSDTSDFVDTENDGIVSTSTTLGVVRTVVPSEKRTRLGIPISSSAPAQLNASPLDIDELETNSVSTLEGVDDNELLPFDDDEFAEKVLEMEAEGAIDEAWQDSRTAYFQDVQQIASILREMKVRNICCVDTSSKTSNFDYIMFGTCEGARHIHLAAWAVQESDRVHRIAKIKRRKTDESWEVVPVGRILVNLMTENQRNDLSLERKWAVTCTMDPLQAANAPVSEGRQAKAHGLWTLTLNLQDLEDFEIDYCKDILIKQW